MLLRLTDGSAVPTCPPASELDRLRADVLIASATVAVNERRHARGAFGIDPRLRAADLRAMARAAEQASG